MTARWRRWRYRPRHMAPTQRNYRSAALTMVAVVCLTAAAGVLAWEPFTDHQARQAQAALRSHWDPPATTTTALAADPTVADASVPVPPPTVPAPAPVPKTTPEGAVARIEIPAIGVDQIVVEGTGASSLRKGPGHYPATAMPGQIGNVAIAGHRTTYGRPFNRVDELAVGDRITLTTPDGNIHVYRVTRRPWVVAYNDWSPIADTPGTASLTLTSCHPKRSDRQRIIVRAELAT